MATIPVGKIKLVNPPQTITVFEAASQTFKSGDLVKVATAGAAVSVASTPATDVGLAVAAADASGVTGARIEIYRIQPETIFEMTLSGVFAAANRGVSYGWVLSGSIFVIDQTNTTNLRFKVAHELGEPLAINGQIGDTTIRVRAVPVYDTGATGVGLAASIFY